MQEETLFLPVFYSCVAEEVGRVKRFIRASPLVCKLVRKKEKDKNHSENSQMPPSAQDQEPLPTPNPLPEVSQLQHARNLCQVTLVPIRNPSMEQEQELFWKWNAVQRSIIFNKLSAKPYLASGQISSPGLTSPVLVALETSALTGSGGQASSPTKNKPQKPQMPWI